MSVSNADTSAAEADRMLFDRMALLLRTNTVCEVVAVSADGTSVDVQPSISLTQRLEETAEIPLPIIRNVPVMRMGSRVLGLYVAIPVQKGDDGVLVISDRALDNWQYGSGTAMAPDMATPRHHDLTDAMFYPGVSRADDGLTSYPTDAVQIRNRAGTVLASISVDTAKLVAAGGSVTVDATGVQAETPGASLALTAATALLTVGAASVGISGGAVALNAPGGLQINGADYLDHRHDKDGGGPGLTLGVTP